MMEKVCGNCKWFDDNEGDLMEGACTAPLPWWVASYRSVIDPYPSKTERKASVCECFEPKGGE